MATGRYIVGIDLGTTQTSMAYADVADSASFPRIKTFLIPQTIRPGAVDKRALLPSCIYLPAEHEFPDEHLALPWSERTPRTDKGVPYTIGEFARARGAERPGRVVASAKSWLSQPGAKRRNALLPWNADPGVNRLSPVEASSLILQHLVSAWNAEFGSQKHNGFLSAQKIVLCVPASFDAAARDLTMEAAQRAGLVDVTLLEEPQAAFYAWIAHARHDWQTLLTVGDLVLIVDIGGGTTDFSLIAVEDAGGSIGLRRIAVGEHILLGGDNMDLALARSAATQLDARGIRLDAWQLRGLAMACRDAKERLLTLPVRSAEEDAGAPVEALSILPPTGMPELKSNVPSDSASYYIRRKPRKALRKAARQAGKTTPLNLSNAKPAAIKLALPILGRGAAVIGESVNASLGLADAERMLLDGFLDACEATARPLQASRSGLRELGLSYATDPSITKHLAKFLALEHRNAPIEKREGDRLRPTAVLFNGGVMKSAVLRARTSDILNQWMDGAGGGRPRELSGADRELAVARGAAFFGRIDQAQGVRINGGIPRSYYIGVESTQPAVPGQTLTVAALCVVAFGMNEGSALDVPDAEFGLTVGEPAQFRFFSASERREDRIGERVELRQDALRELDVIETTIPPTLFDAAGSTIPVRLRSEITTMGTLELWFQAIDGAGAWKLELNVREAQ